MAEAVAAFYAVETVVEGAALGALAVSRSTAPLHLRFQRIASSASKRRLARSGHTLNIVKTKAYVIGGQSDPGVDDSAVLALTLPVASSPDGEGNLKPVDFQAVQPPFKDNDRPLAPQTETTSQGSTFNRTGHTTTAINDKLYIWGGQVVNSASEKTQEGTLDDHFIVFDTLTNTYTTLEADTSKCPDGIPPPRTMHTSTASPHPQPGSSPNGPTTDAQGTIFIHGGTANGKDLRDTWSFNVGTRVWTRLPDIPDAGPSEIANEGKLVYLNGKLWRLGDGFGRVLYLDIAEHQSQPDASVEPPKADKEWQVISFGTEPTDPNINTSSSTSTSAHLPMPRLSAGLLPITTGSGREYLLYFMGWEKSGSLNDFWSFQIDAEANTAASVKDKVRDVVGQAKSSWKSGKYEWAKCEIKKEKAAEKKEKEGGKDGAESDGWPEGLHSFASDVWNDQGGNVIVIWGGKRGDQTVDEGWIVTVD
ncbi:hypothetical protein H2200_002290 [Cladophialophora chaetospira]|uniref:Galactose oxidase n=1 Tax=Cladophialophora chaetospira TaxID=386627 RepID=A0AA39CMX5_9EURO|nr:hypothetical protein H2200_002290 [Cladophialophora chaetospira]